VGDRAAEGAGDAAGGSSGETAAWDDAVTVSRRALAMAMAETSMEDDACLPPPLPPRRRVPHPVLIGHAASLTPY
jgi:hypothetical protein